MLHFIWVFTACKNTRLGVSLIQRVNREVQANIIKIILKTITSITKHNILTLSLLEVTFVIILLITFMFKIYILISMSITRNIAWNLCSLGLTIFISLISYIFLNIYSINGPGSDSWLKGFYESFPFNQFWPRSGQSWSRSKLFDMLIMFWKSQL